MRLTRIHVDAALAPGTVIALPERAAGHLVRVLRLREGDGCVLFNGDGHDHAARILRIDKRGVEVEVAGCTRIDTESPLAITLMQGVARGEKMDLILQKATELGVAAIVPVYSDRSEVKLDGARADKRVAHWQGVLSSACEQSGRARLPVLSAPMPMATALREGDLPSTRWLLSPVAECGISELAAPVDGRLLIAIGPEGGWSPRDLQLLGEAGFAGLRLGPRILRTETAGLAAIAALQARFGDLG